LGESVYINTQEKNTKPDEKTFFNIRNNKTSEMDIIQHKLEVDKQCLQRAQNTIQESGQKSDSSETIAKIDNFKEASNSQDKDKLSKYLEIKTAKGNIQLGYSNKDRKIILMTDQQNDLEASANFSYHKGIQVSNAKVLKEEGSSKKIITQHKAGTNASSATAILVDIDTTDSELIKEYTNIVQDEQTQDTSMSNVMKVADCKSEVDTQQILKHYAKTNKFDKRQINKNLESLKNIIDIKQQYKLNYNSMIKTAVNKIKHQNSNKSFGDFIEIIKKKMLEENQKDEQEQLQEKKEEETT
jgi:hypothetical protein